jgi:hypothetical protein
MSTTFDKNSANEQNDKNRNSDVKRTSQENSLERESKDFVTVFPRTKSILSQYAPTFLPPIST